MTATTIRVDGLRQLGENMRALNSKVSKKICARATSKAAQIIKRRAKAKLKSGPLPGPSIDTGLLEKNVVIKKLGKRDSKLTSEHIAAVRKAQYPNDPDNTRAVANFIEYGTVRAPAEPFMRPAWDAGQSEALTAMTDQLKRGIADVVGDLPK